MADGQTSPLPVPLPQGARKSLASTLARVTLDGWHNIITGLGSYLRDKRMGARAQFDIMTEQEAENIYAADDVAARIVDALPEEALREWITLHIGDDDAAPADDEGMAVIQGLQDKFTELGAQAKLEKAWGWSRLYGGSGILLGVDDSKDLEEPLDLDQVRELRSLTVLSRHELIVGSMSDIDLDFMSPRYGQPNYYRFQPRRGGAQGAWQRIHHSRILRFDGAKLPLRLFITNRYWGDSVLNRAQNAIRNYQTAHDAAATVLQDFNQGVFKIKGLAEMLANNEDDLVQKRLQTIDMARSVCRAVVIDQDEEFNNVGAALSGVDALLTKVDGRLVVASGMPHDKILGDSPSGLGATGESENRVWYDFVGSQQELFLKAPVHRLAEIILRSRKGPTGGKVPDKWSFSFNPLWKEDATEEAAKRKTQAETDEIYIRANVLDPDEVAISRFGSGKWSPETRIDLKARQEAAAPAEPGGGGAADQAKDPNAPGDVDNPAKGSGAT